MKRVAFVIVFFFCILVSPISVFAAGYNTYELDELEISISIPNDHIVFTREISASDPNLNQYGLTKESMESLMKERNIYLNAWDRDVNYEIIVTMTENSLSNFSEISDTVLSTLATTLEDQYKQYGITVIKSEIYQHSQAKFVKLYISQQNNGETVYGLQYYTVNDGKAINITMQSYSGSISSTKEATLKAIVDSAVFWNAPVQSPVPQATASFRYSDDKTGIIFTVPENWSKAQFSQDREFLTAKFTSNNESGLMILYGGYDLWSEMTAAERQGLKRSDIDNSYFSKSDIADIFGLKASDVTTVTYSGKEYYKGIVTSTQNVGGLTISVTMTSLFHFENGNAYNFQTNASQTSSYYKDFESLVSSVEYPITSAISPAAPSNHPADKPSSFMNSWWGRLAIDLLLTIIIHPLPIWIYRYAIKKKPVAKRTAKRIIIVDAVIVVLLMIVITIVTGGSKISFAAVLLWSCICYSSLTKGYVDDSRSSDNNSHQSINAIAQAVGDMPAESGENDMKDDAKADNYSVDKTEAARYCHKCGSPLGEGALFCHRCGTRVEGG